MAEKNFLNKNKIKNNRFLFALSGIIGALLLFLLVLYLSVPSYSFAEIEPFHGDFIYNPYNNENCPVYVDFRSDSVENQGIKVYEFGYALTGTRYLCLNYEKQRKIDFPFLQSIHYKQFNIDKLNKTARLVAPAHPSKGFKKVEMKHLDHYRVMEALSQNDNSLFYWDIALSNGHRVNIIATNGDDFGMVFDDKKFVTACLCENDADKILSSLETGNSYAVAYVGKLSEVPVLQSVTLKNDTLNVKISEKAREIRFIGQNAVVNQSFSNISEAFYVFKNDDTYIRAEIEFDNGNTLYLNPLVRHPYQFFFDMNMASVMKGRTYLMWVVYIIVAVFLIRMFFVNVISTEEKRNGEISNNKDK